MASIDDFPVNLNEYPIAVLSYNQSNSAEACEAYPDGTGDYSNYTVMVRFVHPSDTHKILTLERTHAIK